MTLLVVLVALLAVVVAVVARWRPKFWYLSLPLLGISVAVLVGGGRSPHPEVGSVVQAIAFLVMAVPLGVLLDELGFFRQLARRVAPSASPAILWIVASLVTIVLNLDASVVLLTPLYGRVAIQNGRDPEPYVFQPLLLALLASSVLPVSNLTNLIAAGVYHLTPGAFLLHLAPASVIAIVVGYPLWHRSFRGLLGEVTPMPSSLEGGLSEGASDVRHNVLRIGGTIAIAAIVGFVFGPYVGIAPWEAAGALDIVLIAYLRRSPLSMIPYVPAVTVGTAALAAIELGGRLGTPTHLGGGPVDVLLIGVVSAVLATVANNIPAISVLVVLLKTEPSVLRWAALLGVNMGPSLLVTGSLASILWLSLASEVGVKIRAMRFATIAVRVSVPCFILGLLTLTVSLSVHL